MVLIKDSGRAADFLVNVLEKFSDMELDNICTAGTDAETPENEELREMVVETFPVNPNQSDQENNKTIRKLYDWVVVCLQNRKLVSYPK